MGASYTNTVVYWADRERLIVLLNERGRRAFVSPTINGATAVCDKDSSQSATKTFELTELLAWKLNCAAWGVSVYDDDVFEYRLFSGEMLLDEYNSSPTYFSTSAGLAAPSGGIEEKLCRAFGVNDRDKVSAIGAALHYNKPDILEDEVSEDEYNRIVDSTKYVFEHERHREILGLLGLPTWFSELSYGGLLGRYPKEADLNQFARTEPT